MTVPHRNNVAGCATLRPNPDDQSPVEMTGGDISRLGVVEPVIDNGRRLPGKDLAGLGEVEPAMLKRTIALDRIERDRHRYLLYPQ
jgi:hypothetical protein